MIAIGITGNNGFIGSHLVNMLRLQPDRYKIINFDKHFFENKELLDNFVKQCDAIVHLAALNRHSDPEIIYSKNLELVNVLVDSLKRTNSKAHVIFSSSSQEEKDNLYGKSKKQGREILANWAHQNGGKFTGLIIPNVFGPFGKPNYNSFIATFCYQLTHGETPIINNDGEIKLIYVSELAKKIINQIEQEKGQEVYYVSHTSLKKVSEILIKLQNYKDIYFEKGEIPEIKDTFELNLFNTFRSYFDLKEYYPVKLNECKDSRGAFIEIIRLGIGGQCSFSTTVAGITRGNHFHTRKIERFTVIKGKALIQLRKIDTDEVLNFYLDGNEPAYVDMPIWYTHNIKNIGEEDLYTIFWINETFNPEDSDTYFLEV